MRAASGQLKTPFDSSGVQRTACPTGGISFTPAQTRIYKEFDLRSSTPSFLVGGNNEKPKQPSRTDRPLPIIRCPLPAPQTPKARPHRAGLSIDQTPKINLPKPQRGDTGRQSVKSEERAQITWICLDCASAVCAAPTEIGICFGPVAIERPILRSFEYKDEGGNLRCEIGGA